MALSLPSNIFDAYNDAVDNLWARKITLVYPEVRQECPNCTFNGYKSNGVYKTGGPYPFEEGFPCPYCNGVGYKMIETTEDIYGRIYYNRKFWVDVGIPINIPTAEAQTVCKLTDLSKIQKCKYIIPQYYEGIASYQSQSLVRITDYFPQGFAQNPIKYVVTLWATNV